MALKLKMDTEYGVAVEYWRVGMREEHNVGRHLKVTMLCYLNEASAKGGKSPIALKQEMLDHVYVRDARMGDLYKAVRSLPAWEHAEDC